MVHVSTSRDDALDSEGDEMEVVDQELEEFKQFYFMVKPLKNRKPAWTAVGP